MGYSMADNCNDTLSNKSIKHMEDLKIKEDTKFLIFIQFESVQK